MPTFCPFTGKEQYTSSDAKRVLAGVRSRRRARGQNSAERATYRCKLCGHYHLTRMQR